jgi:hypothetical protein
VAALVGRPLIVASGADLRLDVRVSCSPAGCQARIRTQGASRGLRELEDPDPTCAGLADALAITLAVLLDWTPPAASASSSQPFSASSPASSAPSAPSASSASSAPSASPAPVPAAAASWSAVSAPRTTGEGLGPRSLGVAAGGGLVTGVLPSMAGLWSAEIEARWAIRMSVGLNGAPAQSLGFQGGTVTTRYLAGSLVGCLPVPVGPVELGACGALQLARFQAEGSGFPHNDSTRRLWWLPGLGVDARGPVVGRLGWSVRALFSVRDREQTVSVGSLGTAAHLPRAGIQTRATLTLSFW